MKKILLLVSLFASLAILAQGQTQVVPMTNPHIQLLDASGKPCAGCLLDTFTAGTTSALATFSESTGTSLNSNPIVADANGYVTVYFQLTSYKLRLRSAAGITIYTQDGVSPVSPLSAITSPVIIRPSTAATNVANQSSPTLCFDAFYFNITSLTDAWCLFDSIGTGTSPTTTFSVTHSGSGGTATVNFPNVAIAGITSVAVTGAITGASIGSTTANVAGSGFERMATTDQECWRNAANGGDVCDTDAGAAAAGTGNLADLLKWGGGGFQGGAFVDKSAAPAQSGVERTGNNVCAVASRNAAASGDVCAVQVDGSNITNLGGAAGVKFNGPISGGITGLTLNKQVFTANGTFTIPAGVTSVKVTLVGGGGAGGGATTTANSSGTGGGSGATAVKWLSGLTPGNTILVTIGTAGAGVANSSGGAGGSSTIASGTQTITTVTAGGGVGGSATGGASGAVGGTATNGDINLTGSSPGMLLVNYTNMGSTGGASTLGGGGSGGFVGAGSAAPANSGSGGGGAGGGAGGTVAGGAGGTGLVIFEWTN